MKLFGKQRDSVVVAGIRAARAKYKLINDVDGIEVEFITPDGDRLTLQIPPVFIPGLINNLADAYEAISPPLRSRRDDNQAAFYGMTP